jgi:hypothetical protein
MKKIFVFLNIFFALCIIINSCISEKVEEIIPEEPIIPDPEPDIEKARTFYLRFMPDLALDSTSITTYAGPSLSGSLQSLKWNDSESTGVFLIGGNGVSLLSNKKYDFSIEESIFTETITTAVKTASAYGYTPYQASASGTTVSYTLSNVQDQSAISSTELMMDPILEKNVFTISPASISFDLDGGIAPMTYKSVFAFLRFQVKSSASILSYERIKSAKLYIAAVDDIEKHVVSYALAGKYTIDVSKAPGTSGYSGPVFSQNQYEITSSVTGGEFISDLPNSPYLWFVINPVKIKSSERLISVIETTSGYKIVSKHNIPQLNPNTIYTLPINATEENTVSSQTLEVSGGNSSNCHIVSSAGNYRMTTKKINGGTLTGATVSWLWASKEGGSASFNIKELIDPASLSYNGGYIYFRVGSELGKLTKGNVILALKNQAGEIVWTWHIWITDKPEDYQYEGGKEFLDRNLGALSTVMTSTSRGIDNYGFVYQWGRKDPFFGGTGSTETDVNMPFAINNTIRNGSEWAVSENVTYRTTEMARKNPMTFIVNNTSHPEEFADWLLKSDHTCWLATEKTDDDPCPYGYKVPSKADLASLYTAPNDPDNNPLLYFANADRKYWEYYYINNGSKVAIWPAAGMRLGRGSSGEYSGGQLIYSGTTYTTGQCFYWTSNYFIEGASYRVYTVGTKLYSEDDFGDRADAYSVRCVKMTTP